MILTNSSPDRVLVWGALGFLGQYLVPTLLLNGKRVDVLCRTRHRYPEPEWSSRVNWFELDGGEDRAAVMRKAVSGASIIYSLAGSSGTVSSNLTPLQNLQENCAEHLLFLEACSLANHCPHIVFASSWLVYGSILDLPVDENHPVAPRSMYGAHKACIENYLRIYALREKITYTICRISNPFGHDPSRPKRTYKILNLFIEQSLAGKPVYLFGDGSQLRDFLYIDDLADALMRCGDAPSARNEIFNISLGTSHSMLEAVELIRSLVEEAPPIIFMPWESEYLAVESGSYQADVSKAEHLLGVSARSSLREGLEKTVVQIRKERNDAKMSLL